MVGKDAVNKLPEGDEIVMSLSSVDFIAKIACPPKKSHFVVKNNPATNVGQIVSIQIAIGGSAIKGSRQEISVNAEFFAMKIIEMMAFEFWFGGFFYKQF